MGAIWRFNCQVLQFNADLMTGMGKALGTLSKQCESAMPAPNKPKKSCGGGKPEGPGEQV